MPKAAVNGIDLYYEVDGEGPAIVFAHGAGGNHMSWWQQIPYFKERYRCVTFDHRAFGQSVDTTGEFRHAYPRDLEGLLDHLGIDQTFLVAQSMGGHACLLFAAAHPERVRRLVMADTFFGIGEESVAAPMRELTARRQAARQGDPLPGGFATIAIGAEFHRRNPAGVFLYQQIGALNPPRPGNLLAEPGEGLMAGDLVDFPVPVLFIVGQDDEVIPPSIIEEAHRLIPGSRLEIVPGAGHSVYFEKPDVFNQLVGSFFEEE